MKKNIVVVVIMLIAVGLFACGGEDSGESGGGTPNASPVGTWVGSYQDLGRISSIQLIFKSNMTAQAFHNGAGSGFDIAYLASGNNVTFVENSGLGLGSTSLLTCVSGGVGYMAWNASGTISGNTMTVIYTMSPGAPCTAGGTITLTKQP